MKKLFLLWAFAALASTAWGQTSPPPAPTDFKSDVCAECHMVVTSKSYAAQIVSDGKPLFFDDIGCLVKYQREGKIKDASVKARYVRSVLADAWLAVDQAVWVTTKGVRTPMGYGLHAFPEQRAAAEFLKANKDAKILSWKDVPSAVPDGMGAM
jgi:copper chaperone NosL